MSLTDNQRNEVVKIRLANAEEALHDATHLLDDGSLRGAANRIYYAVFHAVSALALSRGVSFKKHGSLLTYFHREFVKPGVLDRAHGRAVQKAADDRSDADYSDYVTFNEARYFIHLSERLHYLTDEERCVLAAQAEEVSRTLTGLIRAVEKEANVLSRATAKLTSFLVLSLAGLQSGL